MPSEASASGSNVFWETEVCWRLGISRWRLKMTPFAKEHRFWVVGHHHFSAWLTFRGLQSQPCFLLRGLRPWQMATWWLNLWKIDIYHGRAGKKHTRVDFEDLSRQGCSLTLQMMIIFFVFVVHSQLVEPFIITTLVLFSNPAGFIPKTHLFPLPNCLLIRRSEIYPCCWAGSHATYSWAAFWCPGFMESTWW